jgi:hypothetical protein
LIVSLSSPEVIGGNRALARLTPKHLADLRALVRLFAESNRIK